MAAAFSASISLLFLLFLSVSSPSVNGNWIPAVECYVIVSSSLMSCLPFLVIGSKEDKPEAWCCSSVKKVLDTNPECLCDGLKSSLPLKLNTTRTETLPAACKLNPPVSSCKSHNAPASAPAPVPVGGPKSGPRPASAPVPSPSHGSPLTPGPAPASAPVPGSASAPGPGPASAPEPSPSYGSSLTPISGLSFVISGALVVLFSHI